MISSTGRGLSEEEFPRLMGQAFAEELDMPLDQELATVLFSYLVEKEVMVTLSKLKEFPRLPMMTTLELEEELEMSDKEEPDLSPRSILVGTKDENKMTVELEKGDHEVKMDQFTSAMLMDSSAGLSFLQDSIIQGCGQSDNEKKEEPDLIISVPIERSLGGSPAPGVAHETPSIIKATNNFVAPALCRGWGWSGLKGGSPMPAPSRGQMMREIAGQKVEKEKREKEKVEKEKREKEKVEKEKMDLFSAASNHPPSQSSSTADTCRAGTDQGELVDTMQVELNKVGTIF